MRARDFGSRSVREIPSSGWICITSRLGVSCSTEVSRNSTKGARRNWMTISVTRLASRLPVRM